MPPAIKESDWKLLKKLHTVALERFCSRVLSEIGGISSKSSKDYHQRYLTIYQLITKRNDEMKPIFNDLKRSAALFQLAAMRSHGVITDEEFLGFSDETRNAVKAMLG